MKAVGLIVAAGLSQRMGQFKPLLPIGGKPMIERTLSTCVQANIRENIVVVGHCAHLVVQALRHMDVRFLYNAAYQTADMLSSVQLGLDHIATQTDADAAFLLPADMPAISPRLMPRLLSCMEQTGADVVFPSREMRRMHPPLLHRRCFNLVTGYAGEGGLRGAFREMEGRIAYVPTDDAGCGLDVDTPDDYRRVLDYLQEG